MKKILVQILAILCLTTLANADSKNHAKEINSKDRSAIALSKLKASKDTVQLYARGLICESCGLGVRKKLQRLDFVDTKKPKKGIILDVKSQLASIAVKKGKKADPKAIVKAIKGAGYDPVALYELGAGNKLKVTNLEAKAK